MPRAAKVIDLSKYAGKCIARDPRTDEVIAESDNPEKLLEELKRRGIDPRRILIDCVPREGEVWIMFD